MTTLTVRAINEGRPFEIVADDMTLGVLKSILTSNDQAKRTWAHHEEGETLAMMETLIPAMLKIATAKDPSWAGKTPADLEDALSLRELTAFLGAVAELLPEAVRGVDAPLAAPSSAPKPEPPTP